jgi:RHS repeat-associated protein
LSDKVSDSETLWAMTDHLGSVRDIVDDNGTLRKHVEYDSFGNVTDEDHFDIAGDPVSAVHAEAIAQLFAYTGKFFEIHTGLQNNLHRWYDPTLGRWLSEDPGGFAMGDANLYRYVGNAATMWVDPSGKATGGAGLGFNLSAGIVHISGQVDVSIGFWWGIPMDFSIGGTLGGGPGLGLGAGVDTHITGTNAAGTADLQGPGTQAGIATPVGGIEYVEGGEGGDWQSPTYQGGTIGVGPQVGGGVYADNTETGSSVWLFPWNKKAKWWLGIPNPFSTR